MAFLDSILQGAKDIAGEVVEEVEGVVQKAESIVSPGVKPATEPAEPPGPPEGISAPSRLALRWGVVGKTNRMT